MRQITHIVVHCSATPQTTTVESIRNYWKNKLKWEYPGYHYIIQADGTIVHLLDISQKSNGVAGWNHTIINVCYIGGITADKKQIDNRTQEQKQSLKVLLQSLKKNFPHAIIKGHRDFPGVKKDCPCFNAQTEYSKL